MVLSSNRISLFHRLIEFLSKMLSSLSRISLKSKLSFNRISLENDFISRISFIMLWSYNQITLENTFIIQIYSKCFDHSVGLHSKGRELSNQISLIMLWSSNEISSKNAWCISWIILENTFINQIALKCISTTESDFTQKCFYHLIEFQSKCLVFQIYLKNASINWI